MLIRFTGRGTVRRLVQILLCLSGGESAPRQIERRHSLYEYSTTVSFSLKSTSRMEIASDNISHDMILHNIRKDLTCPFSGLLDQVRTEYCPPLIKDGRGLDKLTPPHPRTRFSTNSVLASGSAPRNLRAPDCNCKRSQSSLAHTKKNKVAEKAGFLRPSLSPSGVQQ